MELLGELRVLGPGRFATRVRAPWGQEIEAEMMVATREGWADRPESADPRWSAFAAGPAVVAIRLIGDVEGPGAGRAPRGRAVRSGRD
jgi:hypothetical protein